MGMAVRVPSGDDFDRYNTLACLVRTLYTLVGKKNKPEFSVAME